MSQALGFRPDVDPTDALRAESIAGSGATEVGRSRQAEFWPGAELLANAFSEGVRTNPEWQHLLALQEAQLAAISNVPAQAPRPSDSSDQFPDSSRQVEAAQAVYDAQPTPGFETSMAAGLTEAPTEAPALDEHQLNLDALANNYVQRKAGDPGDYAIGG